VKRILFLCLFFPAFALSFGQQKKICISFDDLPVVSYGITDTLYQKELIFKLINSLTSKKIPAIGFVNEMKLYEKDSLNHFQIRLIENWVNNNLDLGNHTYSHPDYNSVTFNEYARDIINGAKISSELLKTHGRELMYFRHPFLHVGNTKSKADSLEEFLKNNGYTVAPVTVDNEDYLFALAYKRALAKNDIELAKRIGTDYISYMEEKIIYYEQQTIELFGRNICQILLVHASALNSDYIGSLINMLGNRQYTFVSISEALTDPAYLTPVSVYGNRGISWIDKWALSQGKKGDFSRNDPKTPDYIRRLAE
jgi:peptidoglycan/xylan/chitin deacetylase (PgdA/CDA1 family)